MAFAGVVVMGAMHTDRRVTRQYGICGCCGYGCNAYRSPRDEAVWHLRGVVEN
jgi:hypothetical protein